jgi:hypothetical protein
LTVLTVVALGIVDDANAILLRLLKERKTAGSYRTTITGQGA